MARAISALPTPLSPSISTGIEGAPARRPRSPTRAMASPAIRSATPSSPLAEAFMRLISPSSASILSAFLMETSSRSGLTGFTTQATAPGPRAPCVLGAFFDGTRDPPGAPRLHHEVDGAGAHGGHGGFDIAVRGQHDGR